MRLKVQVMLVREEVLKIGEATFAREEEDFIAIIAIEESLSPFVNSVDQEGLLLNPQNSSLIGTKSQINKKTGGGQSLLSAEVDRKVCVKRKLMSFLDVNNLSTDDLVWSCELGQECSGNYSTGYGCPAIPVKEASMGQSTQIFEQVYSSLFT